MALEDVRSATMEVAVVVAAAGHRVEECNEDPESERFAPVWSFCVSFQSRARKSRWALSFLAWAAACAAGPVKSADSLDPSLRRSASAVVAVVVVAVPPPSSFSAELRMTVSVSVTDSRLCASQESLPPSV